MVSLFNIFRKFTKFESIRSLEGALEEYSKGTKRLPDWYIHAEILENQGMQEIPSSEDLTNYLR
jgi:hypothetical protein